MKKIIAIPAIVLLLASCKNHSLTDNAALNAGVQTTTTATQPKVVYKDRVVYTNSSSHTAQVAQKRGWSARAKYGVIGGVGGAVIGGVVTKSVPGAIIGGVIGGGTGYILGRKKDKRTGRLH